MERQEGISENEADELKDAFDLFDKNSDGHISVSELGHVLQAMGQNPCEATIKEIMKKADKDGDNQLTYEEYIALIKEYVKDPVVVEIELREAFRVFDKNRDNSLNFQELKRALTHIGDPLTDKEAIELCALIDTDGDNKVNIDEFVTFLCKTY